MDPEKTSFSEPVFRPCPRQDDVIKISDSQINIDEIMVQIRNSIADQKKADPVFYSLALSEERLVMRDILESLKANIESYGSIGAPSSGFRGRMVFFIKRVIRKLIRRHIEQEKKALESLVALFESLTHCLNQQSLATASCLKRLEKLEELVRVGSAQ